MAAENILFVGPYPPPLNGQSISFHEVYENFLYKKILVNTSKYGNRKYMNNCYSIFRITYYLLIKKVSLVYFTCSRNKFSSIKDLWLIFLCYLKGIRIINHLHGADFQNFINSFNFTRFIVLFLYNKVNTSIILLPAMKDEFKDFPQMNFKIVPNSYPIELSNVTVEFNNKKKTVLYLSNIMYSKGIIDLLEVMDNVLVDNSINLKIAGNFVSDDFKSKREISKLFYEKIEKLKLKFPNRIEYLGVVWGEFKMKLLLETSIFVLPTFYKTEAFPISIIEAMRFGNAVITTNHNYLSEVIDDRNGRLIESRNKSLLQKSIIELFKDEKRLNSIQRYNVKEAKLKYDPSNFNEQMNRILKNT